MKPAKLDRLSDKQLIKAYYALKNYHWPKVLGDKPYNWDRLPNYRPLKCNVFSAIRYRKTKIDLAAPYLDQIAQLIGHRWLKANQGRNLPLKDAFDLTPPNVTEHTRNPERMK